MTIDETQAPMSDIDALQPEEKPAEVSDAQPTEQIAPEQDASEHIATETPQPTMVADKVDSIATVG